MDEADLQGARGKLIAEPVAQWPRPLKAAYPKRYPSLKYIAAGGGWYVLNIAKNAVRKAIKSKDNIKKYFLGDVTLEKEPEAIIDVIQELDTDDKKR